MAPTHTIHQHHVSHSPLHQLKWEAMPFTEQQFSELKLSIASASPALCDTNGFLLLLPEYEEKLVIEMRESIVSRILVLSSDPSSLNQGVIEGQTREFVAHMIKWLELSSSDLVMTKLFFDRFIDTTGNSSSYTYGMSLICAAYLALTSTHDDPLPNSLWTLYSRSTFTEFLSAVMDFYQEIGYSISVTPAQYNATLAKLLPMQTLY